MKTPAFIYKYTHVLTGIVLVGIFSLGGCGGDDGEAVEIPATVPDLLNYDIWQDDGVYLTLSQNPQVTITSTRLMGSYNRKTLALTLNTQPEAMTVNASDYLSQFDLDLGGTDFSNYKLHVTTAMAWVGNNNPSRGELDIYDNEVRKITISVISDVKNTGEPGVLITYYPLGADDPQSSVSDSFTWEQFDGLFDNQATEPYQYIAAFAHSLLRFMYEQGGLVIQTLELISENDVQLEETGSVDEYCDSFYPLTTSSPVSPDPGLIRVNWNDNDNSIDLGPGDNVYLTFIECWDNDESDNSDILYNGGMDLVNYTEVETAGVVTRIGFEPSATGPGGIVYDGLFGPLYITETETDTTASNVLINTSEKITLSGGFSMVFTSP